MRKEQQRFYDSVSSVKCTAGYNINTLNEYKLMLCESTVASYQIWLHYRLYRLQQLLYVAIRVNLYIKELNGTSLAPDPSSVWLRKEGQKGLGPDYIGTNSV